jgi:PKD repeat protein
LLAAVKAAPSSGPAPLRVQFNVHAQGGTAPLSVAWNFGDGSSHESMAAPTHTYATPGVYRATVEIKDAAGDTASHWVEIRVQ